MEVKIAQERSFTDKNGKVYRTFKVFIAKKGVWISELDFQKHPELLIAQQDKIILQEPIQDKYLVKDEKNKAGSFLVLKPLSVSQKNKGKNKTEYKPEDSTIDIVSEEVIEYGIDTDVQKSKKLTRVKAPKSEIKTTKEGFIHGFKAITDPDEIDAIKTHQDTGNNVNLPNQENSNSTKVENPLQKLDPSKRITDPNIIRELTEKTNQATISVPSPKNLDKNNPISFIANLLQDNRVKEKHKERIFEQTAKVIQTASEADAAILKKITDLETSVSEKIEDAVRRIKGIPENTRELKERENFKKHDPKKTVRFLFEFSSNPALKVFTHEETDFNLLEYMELAIPAFKKIQKSYYIDQKTFWKVLRYIFGNNHEIIRKIVKKHKNEDGYWSFFQETSDTVNMNLSWQNAIDWCKENPKRYPSVMPIPKDLKYPDPTNRKIYFSTFGQVINAFKHSIQVRNDDQYNTFDLRLQKIVNVTLLFNNNDKGFNVSWLGSFKDCSFYVDDKRFFYGLKKIFQWCADRHSNSDITIEIKPFDEYYELYIVHHNSLIPYDHNDEKLKGLSGDFPNVRENFTGTCDWEMIAKLINRKTYLFECINNVVNDPKLPIKITEYEPFMGVKHIIRIYKTTNL